MTTVVYLLNTNVVELDALYSAVEETYINDAVVEVTIKDASGNAVPGETWPLTMTYVTDSDGRYRAIISHDVSFAAGTYRAFIDADGGTDRIGHWEFPFKVKTRTTE
jgi:hypothetical protein